MGIHSSKPQYNEAQARYILDFIRLKENVAAYPFINRFNQPFYDALDNFSDAFINERYDIHVAAKTAENAFIAWQKSMFGPALYIPYNLSWFKSADDVFASLPTTSGIKNRYIVV
jgi:hypothetical protein